MASGVFDDALIKHLWSTDELRAIFSDRNKVQKWYDFEAALAKIAEEHKTTPMVGRSHGVQALPITFGHKAAIWLTEMERNYQRLRDLEKRMFVGGMVGAVGTQASFGPKAFELEERVMKRL